MPSPYCGTMKAFAVLIVAGTMVDVGSGQGCYPATNKKVFNGNTVSNVRDLSFQPRFPGAYNFALSVQDYCQNVTKNVTITARCIGPAPRVNTTRQTAEFVSEDARPIVGKSFSVGGSHVSPYDIKSITSYFWVLYSPAGSKSKLLVSANRQSVSFKPDIANKTYTLKLAVYDGCAIAYQTLFLLARCDCKPNVNAGSPKTIRTWGDASTTYALDGSLSSPYSGTSATGLNSGASLTYEWSVTSWLPQQIEGQSAREYADWRAALSMGAKTENNNDLKTYSWQQNDPTPTSRTFTIKNGTNSSQRVVSTADQKPLSTVTLVLWDSTAKQWSPADFDPTVPFPGVSAGLGVTNLGPARTATGFPLPSSKTTDAAQYGAKPLQDDTTSCCSPYILSTARSVEKVDTIIEETVTRSFNVVCKVVLSSATGIDGKAKFALSDFKRCRGVFQFQLSVSDSCNTVTDSVHVTFGCNQAPVVDLQADQFSFWVGDKFQSINVDGRRVSDVDDVAIFNANTFNNNAIVPPAVWTVTPVKVVADIKNGVVQPAFGWDYLGNQYLQRVLTPYRLGTYAVQLTATDQCSVTSDVVNIEARCAQLLAQVTPNVVNYTYSPAGPDVALTGDKSIFNVNAAFMQYKWQMLSKPATSKVDTLFQGWPVISSSQNSKFRPDVGGSYVLQFSLTDNCPQPDVANRTLTANLTVNYICDPDGLKIVDAGVSAAKSDYQPATLKYASVRLTISKVNYNANANGDKFTYKIQYSLNGNVNNLIDCGAACAYVTLAASMDPKNTATYGFKRATHFSPIGADSGKILDNGVPASILVDFTPPNGGVYQLFATTSDGCKDIPQPVGSPVTASCNLPTVTLATSDGSLVTRVWKDFTNKFGPMDTIAGINGDPPAPYSKNAIQYRYSTGNGPSVGGAVVTVGTLDMKTGGASATGPQASGLTTWRPTVPGTLCVNVEAQNECTGTIISPIPNAVNTKSICIVFACKDRNFPLVKNGVKEITVSQEQYQWDIYKNPTRSSKLVFKPVVVKVADVVDMTSLTANLAPDTVSVLTYEWVVKSIPPSSSPNATGVAGIGQTLQDAATTTGRLTDTLTFTPDAPGVYDFIVRVSDGCKATEYPLRVTANCIPLTNLQIVGNPASRVAAYYFDGLRFPKIHLQLIGSYGTTAVGSFADQKFTQSNIFDYTWEIVSSPANSIYSASKSAIPFQEITTTQTGTEVKSYTATTGSLVQKPDDIVNTDFTQTTRWIQKSRSTTTGTISTTTYLRNHNQDNAASTCLHPDLPGQYQIRVTVSDGCTRQLDPVLYPFVTVCNPPTLKFKDGASIVVVSSGVNPARIALDMSTSSLASGSVGVLTYSWTIDTAPRLSVMADKKHLQWLTNPHGPIASFLPDQPGVYKFNAEIYDGCRTASDSLTVTVQCSQSPSLRVNATVLDTAFQAAASAPGAQYAQTGKFFETRLRGIYQDQAGTDLSCSAKKWEWSLLDFSCTNPVPMPPPAAVAVASADTCQAAVMCAWTFAKVPCQSKLTDDKLVASPDNGEGRFAPKVKFQPDVSGVYVLSFSCSDGCSSAEDNVTVYARCRNQFDVAKLSDAVAFKQCPYGDSVFDEVALTPTISQSQPAQGFGEYSKCPITQLTAAPVAAKANAPPKRCCPKCPSCPVCPSCPQVACPACPACPPFAVCQIVNGVDNCTNAVRPMSLQDEQGHAFETTPSRSPPMFDASSRRSAPSDSMAVEARVVLEEALGELSSEQYHDMLQSVETVVATLLNIPVGSVSVGMEADEKTLIILVQGEDHSRVTATLTEAYSAGHLVFGDAGRAARITVEVKSTDEPVHTLAESNEEFEADSDSRERVLWLSAVIPMSVLVILSIAANFVFISHYGSLVKGTFRPVSTHSTMHAL